MENREPGKRRELIGDIRNRTNQIWLKKLRDDGTCQYRFTWDLQVGLRTAAVDGGDKAISYKLEIR